LAVLGKTVAAPCTPFRHSLHAALGVVALAALQPFASSHAGQAQQFISVSARVMATARLEWLATAPELLVSAADIQRGYVDLPQPALMRVSSNSRRGYALDIYPRGEVFESVLVRGLDSTVQLGRDGGTIVQRWGAPGSASLRLSFRFALAAGVEPGSYPLPLLVQVRALEFGE
jgi:hypothetical protein